MTYDTSEHYQRLAGDYDRIWEQRSDYVTWMNDHIATRLLVSEGECVADIGAGSGLFLRKLAEKATAENPIVCIDPFQEMLDQLPDDKRLKPLCARAEDVAAGHVPLPYTAIDAILIKETIHHIKDIPETLAGLARLLASGGRILVVTLPPRLDYPIFQAALDRFATYQPEPKDLADSMQGARLSVDLSYDEYPVSIERDHFFELVGKQWMSVLSTFSDQEVEAGLEEMRERYPEQQLSFVDRFAFVLGKKN